MELTVSDGDPVKDLAIPAHAKRVDFVYRRRKAYAYGWWSEAPVNIHIVAAYSCGVFRDRVNFQIPVPGGSFPRDK